MDGQSFSSAIAEAKHEIEFIDYELGRMGREEGNKPERKAALLKIIQIIDMYNDQDYKAIAYLGNAGEFNADGLKIVKMANELDRAKLVIDDLIRVMLISAQRYDGNNFLKRAISAIGHKEVIKIKLEMDLTLSEVDNKFIIENL